MAVIGQKNILKSSSNSPTLGSLLEQFDETKQLLAKWIGEIDRILRESRVSVDEFNKSLDIFARRIEQWKSMLKDTMEGNNEKEIKEEELVIPIKNIPEKVEEIKEEEPVTPIKNIPEKVEEIKEEEPAASVTNITDEEKDDIKGYVLALKRSGWSRNKILETLFKTRFNRGKFDWKTLNAVTEEVFAQNNY